VQRTVGYSFGAEYRALQGLGGGEGGEGLLRQLLAIDATGTESIGEEALKQRMSLSKPPQSSPSQTRAPA
jgi:hypothetical protein